MSIVTTFETQCRALASTPSPDEYASRFLVGTQTPASNDNYIYLFEYKDDNTSLAKIAFKFPHGEIWHLATSCKHPDLLSVVSQQQGKYRISVYKLPPGLDEPIEDDYGLSEAPIEKICDLAEGQKKLTTQCHWHPDKGHQLLTCCEDVLQIHDNEQQNIVRTFSIKNALEKSQGLGQSQSSALQSQVVDMKWSSLFNCSVIATALGNKVCGFDTRIPDTSPSSICWLIEDERCNRIRSIDFNPNSQYYLATGGDDCRAKFWDLRRTSEPAIYFQAHTHWIWSIRYNPFHDQLVLSGGSDGRAVLMRAQSISSEPNDQVRDDEDEGEDEHDSNEICQENQDDCDIDPLDKKPLDKEGNNERINDTEKPKDHNVKTTVKETTHDAPKDEIIKVYDEHDDSVYSVEWASDPWIFASLGYESRLIINKVPKEEKFNILFR